MNRSARATLLSALGIALVLGAFGSKPAWAASLYVSNFNSNTITAYDSSGRFLSTFVRGGPELNGADGLAAGNGNLYVTGQFSNTVVAYSGTNGSLVRVLDPGNAARMSSPQGVTLGPDGLLYVASFDTGNIARYNPVTGAFLGNFPAQGIPSGAGLQDVVFGPDGKLYVSAYSAGEIFRFNPSTGSLEAVLRASAGGSFGSFASFGFGFDGNIYADLVNPTSFTGEVGKYSPNGAFLGVFVPPGSGGLNLTGGIAFGPDGNLYVASVRVDSSFRDTGSSILRFDGRTGAPLGTFVGPGNGLDVPFSFAFSPGGADTPEPASCGLVLTGLLAGVFTRLRRKR